MSEPAAVQESPPPVLLFDGECGLCDRTVQTLLRWDRRGVLRFAPLQGETAAPILARHGIQPTADGFASLVLVLEADTPQERALQRSSAALEILRRLGGLGSLLALLGWLVPRFLRDAVYDWIARRRHRWFAPPDACRVPTPGERQRFLP